LTTPAFYLPLGHTLPLQSAIVYKIVRIAPY